MRLFLLILSIVAIFLAVFPEASPTRTHHNTRRPRYVEKWIPRGTGFRPRPRPRPTSSSSVTMSVHPVVRSFQNDEKHGKGLHIDVDVKGFLKRRTKRV
ncbi:hypothetical protein CAEBREN_14038 [Caenorhabditis brenneri]|uniref:Uncharacterized protein n=1 Tax=Caenorhabditis brenneri TaxID=135651 RepID=G0MVV3_CAEBE|nr:hypothetical protein CAEBREN_14038 [Caenorhabditis brenneri]